MAFVRTPLTCKRVPKHFQLAFVDANPLTLDVASPRQADIPYEQRAMRVLAALHEATHAVAMVEFGDRPWAVTIAINPITTSKGFAGRVWGAKEGNYENEGFVTLLGSTFEFLMLSTPSHPHMSEAFYHDAKQAETDWRNWYTYMVSMGKLDGPAEKHVAAAFDDGRAGLRATEYINSRWPLIDLYATALLVYNDHRGEVGRNVIHELNEVVAKRLTKRWPVGCRSESPVALRSSLPPDVLSIWRKHSPHTNLEDWAEVA